MKFIIVCVLLNKDVCNSGYEYIASSGGMLMHSELEGMWKESVLTECKV